MASWPGPCWNRPIADPFAVIVRYVPLAMGAGLAGALAAVFWRPRARARSALQHFAAGVVIAAVALEVIPGVERIGTAWGILGGFTAGGVTMIGLKWLVLRFERGQARRHKLPVGLAAAAAVDTLIDGAILSAGFFSGPAVGPMLTVALGLELFFLTLAVGSGFRASSSRWWPGLPTTAGIAAMLPIGAFAGYVFLRGADEGTVAVVLAFGAAALIYLVAEELLVEAIEAEESLLSTAMLFTGFLAVIAFRLASHGRS